MKITLLTACFLLLIQSSYAQPNNSQKAGLPPDALIFETQAVSSNRKMILWMQKPVKHPNENPESDFYACPDETRGSYYRGPVRVTLIDSTSDQLINTLAVKDQDGDSDSPAEIDLPYAILGGYFYTVLGSDQKKESKPRIMDLKDYNGDGRALEFALYDKEACQGLATTLVGYSEKQDRVIQYPIKLTSNGKTETLYWVDYLFAEKPVPNGFWKYQIDYRGRGGTLDKYKIRYNKQAETFEGELTSIEGN